MDYTRLGSTGLDVSRLCLGCMTFGIPERGNYAWMLDEDASRPILRKAIEAGINFLDTANVDSDGTTEEIVRRALNGFTRREEGVIATKVHGRMRPGPNGVSLRLSRDGRRRARGRLRRHQLDLLGRGHAAGQG